MLRRVLVLGLLALPLVACSAGSGRETSTAAADASTGDVGSVDDGGALDVALDDAPVDGACAASTFEGKQDPASIMFVLDASDSMATGGKWSSAALAIVSAIDGDAFDTMSIGLLASPSSLVTGPACVFGFPVACGGPAVPQIAIQPAGKEKSSASTGVRKQIYDWLGANAPKAGLDGTPLYDALKTSYDYLRLSAAKAKRIAVVITDGSPSCASLSARGGYTDVNGCQDWEHPTSLIDLIEAAHDDATAPVQTFVVGVPGSDTVGADPNREPPYISLRALSAYAKAGSPETIDPTCDGEWNDKLPAAGGTKPAKPCHLDMSATGSFDAKKLGEAIAKIRGSVLGCVYDLPTPTDGGAVDKNRVNVRVESGGAGSDVPKRSDPSDTCATDGCWDYTADGRVELLGKACETAKSATDGKVSILVGCATVVK